MATNDATLMIEPRACRCMYGMTCLQHRYTDRRFTSCTRCHISVDVVRIESSAGGEMPALWNDTSIAPYRSNAVANAASTSASEATSACTNRPSTAAAAACPAGSSMSTATTCAPSAARRWAAASPIPLPAPVITATRSRSLSHTKARLLPPRLSDSQNCSKQRRRSQSVTTVPNASHSCRAVFTRCACTSGPNASTAAALRSSAAMASTMLCGTRATSCAS